MAGRLFDIARNLAVDAIADQIALASLHTADPGSAGSANEVTGGSYARGSVTGTAWPESSGRSENNVAITFPNPTANWGAIPFVVFRNSGADPLITLDVNPVVTINSGDTQVQFPVNAAGFSALATLV